MGVLDRDWLTGEMTTPNSLTCKKYSARSLRAGAPKELARFAAGVALDVEPTYVVQITDYFACW